MSDKTVELNVVVKQETPRAWLVETEMTKNDKWFPKSMVEIELDEPFSYLSVKGVMIIPEWLAIKEGLV